MQAHTKQFKTTEIKERKEKKKFKVLFLTTPKEKKKFRIYQLLYNQPFDI